MIPYDIDPSLHSADSVFLLLDDGFSAPRTVADVQPQVTERYASLEEALASQSEF